MARRVVTDKMRETAQMRAHAYLAARAMNTAEVAELASYHGRVVRVGGITPQARREALATSRMLGTMYHARTARAGSAYVAPRVRSAAPRRSRRGR
jgi:hypothetical protein